MTKKSIPDPIFNFSVADWQYICAITSCIGVPYGDVDVFVVIIKDGIYKAKSRIEFPSGNRMLVIKDSKSLEQLIEEIRTMILNFPDRKDSTFVIIHNKGTSGQELLNAMCKCPDLELKSTSVKNDI